MNGETRFGACLLGGTPVEWYPGWVTLEPPPHGQRLSFQATTTPLVPDVARVHFDILVEDLALAHDRVLAAGATSIGEHVSPRPDPGGEPVPWRVYRDPAGHPFCLVVR
jgi:Glyoxalase-like domain